MVTIRQNPLGPLLGSSPKFSDGVTAAKSDIKDDTRCAIPQNAKRAIKSDYLLSIAEMIADASLPSRAAPFTPEAATACIGLGSAW